MEISYAHLKELYHMLSERTGYPLDRQGFDDMATKIGGGITQKYLYENHYRLKKAKNFSEHLGLQNAKLKAILDYLDFESLEAFIHYLQHPIPQVLASCAGSWISYVRQNSYEGIIFKSPVHIHEENKRMLYKLRGPHSTFHGEMSCSNGCLFSLFKGANGKQFHHIYKIGKRESPRILQGIYSGISTAGDPIGGRTILIRSDQEFDSIKNEKLSIEELAKSQDRFEKGLAIYMQHFEKNNLRLNPIVSFDVEDLYS